jgi:hypothetical protein
MRRPAFGTAEHRHASGVGNRLARSTSARRLRNRTSSRRFRPVRGIGGTGSGSSPEPRARRRAATQGNRSRPPGSGLMPVGCANPRRASAMIRSSNRHRDHRTDRGPPGLPRPGTGYEASQSSPGICGKPRKFRKFANLVRQVVAALSHPRSRGSCHPRNQSPQRLPQLDPAAVPLSRSDLDDPDQPSSSPVSIFEPPARTSGHRTPRRQRTVEDPAVVHRLYRASAKYPGWMSRQTGNV